MLRLSPKTTRILRWLAFLPIVFAVFTAVAPVGFIVTVEGGIGGEWLINLTIALGAGTAVYLGSRVAPSRRPWPTVLAAALVLLGLLCFLYGMSLFADFRSVSVRIMLASTGAAAAGAFLNL